MNILALETSCDETAAAVLRVTKTESESVSPPSPNTPDLASRGFLDSRSHGEGGSKESGVKLKASEDFADTLRLRREELHFSVLADVTQSQINLHREWGGVVPSLAKREHAKNIIPVIDEALEKAQVSFTKLQIEKNTEEKVQAVFSHLPELGETLLSFVKEKGRPDIEAITVTVGPGLEPALWVGINTAEALGLLWNVPVVGANHMEGHILSILLSKNGRGTYSKKSIAFPALSLLVSGGHTELVLMEDWLSYKVIGQTKDDAAGEAFDKVARILGLPYPGGPEISKLAAQTTQTSTIALPRPMLHSKDFNFSFSGLKTAVLYGVKKEKEMTEEKKQEYASEFQNAVVEVLVKKTLSAAETYGAQSIILGGGVSANTLLRETLEKEVAQKLPGVKTYLPERKYSTDNAVMIGIAGYFALEQKRETPLVARGNLSL